MDQADEIVDAVNEARRAPGGEAHWRTRYDEDGDPYGALCFCNDTDGEDHE